MGFSAPFDSYHAMLQFLNIPVKEEKIGELIPDFCFR